MNLILLDPSEVGPDGLVTLRDARAEHLRRVLMVAPGDEVRVGLLDGGTGAGAVASIADEGVALRCRFEGGRPPRPRVDLFLALPRPKVMRRLWAQLAALGVGQVILTNAERVERDYFGSHLLTPEVYRPLLVEGLQQARDTRVPVVSIHRRFKVLVEDDLEQLFPEGTRVVGHPGCEVPVGSVAADAAGRVLLAVGPEGGWNDFELRLLEAHGFRAVGMGPRTLRTDTACIALLSLVHAALR